MEWKNGVFTIPFSNSNSELELKRSLSSQIIQCLSNVALFVSFRDPVRGFVSEGVAKAAGFRRDSSIGAMRQHQALKRIVSSKIAIAICRDLSFRDRREAATQESLAKRTSRARPHDLQLVPRKLSSPIKAWYLSCRAQDTWSGSSRDI